MEQLQMPSGKLLALLA